MSRQRTPMRKNNTVLRLAQHEQLSESQIARATNMRSLTVRDCLERASAAAMSWPFAFGMDDAAIAQMLFPVQLVNSTESSAGMLSISDHASLRQPVPSPGATMHAYYDNIRLPIQRLLVIERMAIDGAGEKSAFPTGLFRIIVPKNQ
jgi:hypothetical protein